MTHVRSPRVGRAVHRSRTERGRGMRAGDDALALRAKFSHVTATTRDPRQATGLTHLAEPSGCLGRLHVDAHVSSLANPPAFSTPQPGLSYTPNKGAAARCPRRAQCSEDMARVSGGGHDVGELRERHEGVVPRSHPPATLSIRDRWDLATDARTPDICRLRATDAQWGLPIAAGCTRGPSSGTPSGSLPRPRFSQESRRIT